MRSAGQNFFSHKPSDREKPGKIPDQRAEQHPAPGFRDAGNNKRYGTWYRVGGGGYSWSTTGARAYARFLYFNYGFLARQTNKTPGGRGFQLRCLQVPLGTRTGPDGCKLLRLRSRAGPRARGEPAILRIAWAIRVKKPSLSARWRKSRAGFLAILCDANPGKAPVGRSPAGISSRLCSRTTVEIPLKAGGRCLPALGTGLTGEKTFSVRAPGEIIPDKLTVYRRDFLLRRGARGLRELRSRAGPRARGGLAKLRFARA